jgi:hypothetical protein
MGNDLRKTYFVLLVPAVIGLIFIYLAKELRLISITQTDTLKFFGPLIFIASVSFAIALPIFFRTLFAHKLRDKKEVLKEDWVTFERHLIYIALVTPYLIMPALLLEIPSFYFGGTVLMALYAAYYFYPSDKKMLFEQRIFRIK